LKRKHLAYAINESIHYKTFCSFASATIIFLIHDFIIKNDVAIIQFSFIVKNSSASYIHDSTLHQERVDVAIADFY